MEPPVYLGHEELIERFSFRERGSIKIPKEVREIAHSFQLDIEILSTRGNDYVNGKSIPAYGFYGYVVLVMRDHSEIQIPINQPRQVLFRERIAEAYANWYALYLKAVNTFELAFINNAVLVPIGEALGATVGTPQVFCPDWSGFKEIELREVYVKCPFGTRFKLEASYEYPNEVIYGECNYDGKSRRTDAPEKDDGLPADGVQPAKPNDPSNPYADFPTPSEEMELGNWSNNSKLSNVDNENPANQPEEPEEEQDWLFSFQWTVLDSSGNPLDIPCSVFTLKRGLLSDTITVTYQNVIGVSNAGEDFYRVAFSWQGSVFWNEPVGFRMGSVQECGRVVYTP